jgi:hypothetical protein
LPYAPVTSHTLDEVVGDPSPTPTGSGNSWTYTGGGSSTAAGSCSGSGTTSALQQIFASIGSPRRR